MSNHVEVALQGRVGTDPELRQSQAGKPFCRFNVAVGEDDAVQWVSVAVFNAKAEEVAATVRKGTRVYIEGTLKLQQWTDRDGQQRAGLSVAAFRCRPLYQIGERRPPRKPASAQDAATPSSPVPTENASGRPTAAVAKRNYQAPLDADSIPF